MTELKKEGSPSFFLENYKMSEQMRFLSSI